MFITFEGTEGAGKSTMIQRLCDHLEALGYSVQCVREPGSTAVGEEIRSILLDYELVPEAQLGLFLAARAQLVHNVIRPLLDTGVIVIADRFIDSTVVIQGFGQGLPVETLREVNAVVTRNLVPDLTLFLDVDPKSGLDRKIAQGDFNKLDAQARTLGERYREGYYEQMLVDPYRWRYIDAGKPADQVFASIVAAVIQHPSFPLNVDL